MNKKEEKLSIGAQFRRLVNMGHDKAPEAEIIAGIEDGVSFQGAKLWILVLAIFVASLGLNTNSTAVIIGAMLISPLMGPIIGMGLGVGVYDFALLKRAFRSYLVATAFSVATATLYFLLTPIDEAQSELLARTSPTIYDVGIAICGGLAGIIALSSKSQRTGNVIPGVAIATALMPPLCTVGFGLATANWLFAAGALYLYIINTIFIALSTFVGVAFIMRFHKQTMIDKEREKKVHRYITTIALLTIVPSIFITIGIVRKTIFEQHAQAFVHSALEFDHAQVIDYSVDYKQRTIRVVMLGEEVDSAQIDFLKKRLPDYHLASANLQLVQTSAAGIKGEMQSMLKRQNVESAKNAEMLALAEEKAKKAEQQLLQYQKPERLSNDVLQELQLLFPQVDGLFMAHGMDISGADSTRVAKPADVAVLSLRQSLPKERLQLLQQWLRQRTSFPELRIVVE